jgi:GH43 family beta-xylosidase
MSELKKVEAKVIWTPPATGMWSNSIWAPEIHFLQGKWYVYFAADNGDNANLRMFVVENASSDPFQGKWVLQGQIKPATDRWAIDGSVFENNGLFYFIWSGMSGKEENVAQNIYIAQLENPWTIKGDRVLISTPEFPWESKGATSSEPKVNEGPTMLKGSDKLFITYSASGCWTDDYCLGMLTASAGADLLNPASWTKSKEPVLEKSVEAKVFAPGHNGFFKTMDGKEDWIIFHANEKSGDGCGDLRKTRMQKITWRSDGTPDFGIPVSNKTQVKKPSGE